MSTWRFEPSETSLEPPEGFNRENQSSTNARQHGRKQDRADVTSLLFTPASEMISTNDNEISKQFDSISNDNDNIGSEYEERAPSSTV